MHIQEFTVGQYKVGSDVKESERVPVFSLGWVVEQQPPNFRDDSIVFQGIKKTKSPLLFSAEVNGAVY